MQSCFLGGGFLIALLDKNATLLLGFKFSSGCTVFPWYVRTHLHNFFLLFLGTGRRFFVSSPCTYVA